MISHSSPTKEPNLVYKPFSESFAVQTNHQNQIRFIKNPFAFFNNPQGFLINPHKPNFLCVYCKCKTGLSAGIQRHPDDLAANKSQQS